MEEHHARAAILLSHAANALDRMALPLLARCILDEPIDLVMPRYLLEPQEGLLNNAILYPLTRALYRSSVRFPLGGDLAISVKFAQALDLRPRGVAFSGEDPIVWLVAEALRTDSPVAEAPMRRERPAQAEVADIAAMFTRVVGSVFSDIELRDREWQTSSHFLQARRIRAGNGLELASNGPTAPADVTQLIESFRLAGKTLQEIWAQAMTPRTLLAVMRLAAQPEGKFSLPNALWVRIVYDFLVAHREQAVNRNHLVGALMPLYFGWAASHLIALGADGESAAEQRIEALAAAFEADKPYLLARWRWPDSFNP
jgi:hypothetical protein